MDRQSFGDFYDDIIGNIEWWDYYMSMSSYWNENFSSIIKNPVSFIQKYIKEGGKIQAIKDKELKSLTILRLNHIISVFFLGIGLYRNCTDLKNIVDVKIGHLSKVSRKYKPIFSYLWFMMAFFHDLGYLYEESTNLIRNNNSANNIKNQKLWRKCKYLYGYFPDFFDKKLCLLYERYREDKFKTQDHGIVIGPKLFERLCNTRIQKKGKDEDLYWGQNLVRAYRFVSWIIAVHNIWFCNESDREKVELYKQYHLEKLILKGGNNIPEKYPIPFSKYPLLFLFCLVDSIEPIKANVNLNDLKISIEKDEIILSSPNTNYLNKIERLNEWLTRTKRENKKVTIYLNNE